MDVSALKQYGQWLLRTAKEQGLLKYGMGPDRLTRILDANPSLVIKSDIPRNRDDSMISGATGLIKAKMTGVDGKEMSGYIQPINRKSDVSAWNNTSPDAATFAKRDTPPHSKFGVAHMLGAEKGGGSSGVFYPAFGELMAQENRYLLPDSFITHDNLPNRFLKSIGTELNHEKPVFVPHEDQIGMGTPSPIRGIADFTSLPGNQRGALAFIEGQKALEHRLLQSIDYAQYSNDPVQRRGAEKLLRITKMDPNDNYMGYFDEKGRQIDEIDELVRLLHKLGIENVGRDTFRRGQAMRHMESGTDAPPEMVDKLFFCKGGLAQMSHALRHVP